MVRLTASSPQFRPCRLERHPAVEPRTTRGRSTYQFHAPSEAQDMADQNNTEARADHVSIWIFSFTLP
jgi:hypothetical protein